MNDCANSEDWIRWLMAHPKVIVTPFSTGQL